MVVQLSSPIYITAVTIEHISSLLSPDGSISSAPASLSLTGLPANPDLAPTSLLNFTYNREGEPVQTFWLGEEAGRASWQTVELGILSNHGHPEYTCLYRLRVHGRVEESVSQH